MHPNILRFMGVCVQQGQLHALTEYMNGGNLEQLLHGAEPLSWSVRVKLSLGIARGLRYLHSKGVFHRDLTSKNCLVRCDESGYTAVVGDFGLAERIPDHSQTEPLSVVGSPYWMAPEVLHGDLYNEKADVFAFGIILCEIIARIPADPDYLPRTEDFGLDITAFQNMVQPDCPSAFLQLAFHCCRMAPEVRPSFCEVSQWLEEILESMDGNMVTRPLIPPSKEAELITPGSGGRGTTRCSDNQQPLWDVPTPPDQRLSRSQSDMFSPQPLPILRSQDPYDDLLNLHYTRARVNPFSQREDLKGGRIKLFDTPSKSVISLTFDLPQPTSYQLSSPVTPEPVVEADCNFSEPVVGHRRCRSLPSSPEMCRRGSPYPSTTPYPATTSVPRGAQGGTGNNEREGWPPAFRNSKETGNYCTENRLNVSRVSQERGGVGLKHPSDNQSQVQDVIKPSGSTRPNGASDTLHGEDQTPSKTCPKETGQEEREVQLSAKTGHNERVVDWVGERHKEGGIPQWNGDRSTGNTVPQRRDQGWRGENPAEDPVATRKSHYCEVNDFSPEQVPQEDKFPTADPESRGPQERGMDWSRPWNQDTGRAESSPHPNNAATGEPMDCSSSPESTEENTFCQRPPLLLANGPFPAPSPTHSSASSTPSSSRSPSPPVGTWQQEPLGAPNRLSLSDNNNVVCSKPRGWVGLLHSGPLGSHEVNSWEGSLPGLGCGGESGSTDPLHASSNSVLDHEEAVSCPACCLGSFSFISVCRRPPPDTSRYQNLNCEATHGLIRTAPRLGTPRPGPSRKLPEAQT
ncbi:dual specificity testis-specific protein kinase 1 isoform X2 [Ascaphus truei]|uniref:dual specificity testis-specific protein kinase 1 isoform X2 n=1 Tax=Ascaphus truei TaxID=8439 RepID=UPI003F59CC10